MANISRPSNILGPNNYGAPFTPIRRFLSKFDPIRPVLTLGKRNRENSCMDGAISLSNAEEAPGGLRCFPEDRDSARSIDGANTVHSSFPPADEGTRKHPSYPADSPPQRFRRPALLAIQHDDTPFDAVVVTTLPCYPFCCHEDLLTMSRQQLVEVALLFNSRLPRCWQIEVSDVASNANIRFSIETLVGIVPDIPGAPKGVKFRTLSKNARIPLSYEDPLFDILPSPPTSPLAMRVSRRRDLSLMTSPPRMLECLQEEDEDLFFANQRPLKRRKLLAANATSTHISLGSTGEGPMDLASSAALKFSPITEVLVTPASLISPGEEMILSSPLPKYVADSVNSRVTSVPSGGITLSPTKPTPRVVVSTDGRLAGEHMFSRRPGLDGPVGMDVSWGRTGTELEGTL